MHESLNLLVYSYQLCAHTSLLLSVAVEGPSDAGVLNSWAGTHRRWRHHGLWSSASVWHVPERPWRSAHWCAETPCWFYQGSRQCFFLFLCYSGFSFSPCCGYVFILVNELQFFGNPVCVLWLSLMFVMIVITLDTRENQTDAFWGCENWPSPVAEWMVL